MSVKRICEVIVRDEKSILSVSLMMHEECGIEIISLSMPAIVGANGVETLIPINLSKEENKKLQKSAKTLKKALSENIE